MAIERVRIFQNQPIETSVLATLAAVLFGLTVIGLPITLIILTTSIQNAQRRCAAKAWDAGRAAFAKYVGKAVQYLDVDAAASNIHAKAANVYGIATDGENVYFVEHGIAATIPWNLVRSWSWKIEGYDETSIIRGDYGDHRNAAKLTQKAAALAHHQSGLFLQVADIDHPTWHFKTVNQKLLQRWNEILKQLNDGQLPKV